MPPDLPNQPAQGDSCTSWVSRLLHLVEVVGLLLVQDDEVGAQPLHAPVLLRVEQLAHERQRRRRSDPHQHDGQVAGDVLSPQVLLAVAIGRQIGRAEQRVVGPEHARGQPIEEDGVLVAQPQVLQRDVDVREGHREGPRRRAAVAVLARQRQRGRAIGRDAGGEGDANRRRRAPAGCARAARRSDRARRRSCPTRPGRRARAGSPASGRGRGIARGRFPTRPIRPAAARPRRGRERPRRVDSSAARGRRVNSRPALCGSNSDSTNSLPNAGCAKSSCGRASAISA